MPGGGCAAADANAGTAARVHTLVAALSDLQGDNFAGHGLCPIEASGGAQPTSLHSAPFVTSVGAKIGGSTRRSHFQNDAKTLHSNSQIFKLDLNGRYIGDTGLAQSL